MDRLIEEMFGWQQMFDEADAWHNAQVNIPAAPNPNEAIRRHAMYAEGDFAKRHRLPDQDPKVVNVDTHRRRLPAK